VVSDVGAYRFHCCIPPRSCLSQLLFQQERGVEIAAQHGTDLMVTQRCELAVYRQQFFNQL